MGTKNLLLKRPSRCEASPLSGQSLQDGPERGQGQHLRGNNAMLFKRSISFISFGHASCMSSERILSKLVRFTIGADDQVFLLCAASHLSSQSLQDGPEGGQGQHLRSKRPRGGLRPDGPARPSSPDFQLPSRECGYACGLCAVARCARPSRFPAFTFRAFVLSGNVLGVNEARLNVSNF